MDHHDEKYKKSRLRAFARMRAKKIWWKTNLDLKNWAQKKLSWKKLGQNKWVAKKIWPEKKLGQKKVGKKKNVGRTKVDEKNEG